MRNWALLTGAITTEVAATLSLRASQDHAIWLAVVVVGYVASFALLTLVLRAGVAVGVAYGIWGAIGTALTAVLGAALFRDPPPPGLIPRIRFWGPSRTAQRMARSQKVA